MATVTVTGTIKRPTGKPWYSAPVSFGLADGTSTMDATYPMDAVAITAADGTFAIDLEAGIGATWICQLPDGERFRFELPAGTIDPIAVEVLRATYSPPNNPQVPTIIDINEIVVVSTTSAQLVPATPNRGDTLIWNQGSATIYVAFDEPATVASFPIPAGYNIVVTTTQAINARSQTGSVVAYVLSEVHQ